MIPQAREPSALAINSCSRCKPCDINATSDSVNMTLYKYPNESWLNGQKNREWKTERKMENTKIYVILFTRKMFYRMLEKILYILCGFKYL